MQYSNNRFLLPIVKKTTLRLKLSIKQRWQRFFFGIAFSAASGKIIIPSAIEQLDITNSSTVLNKKSKILYINKENVRAAQFESDERFGFATGKIRMCNQKSANDCQWWPQYPTHCYG